MTSTPGSSAGNVPPVLFDGPEGSPITFAFAHGAGAAMDTPFMDVLAAGVASEGVRVARFELPYMQQRRADGRRRAPDRPAVLLETWRMVVHALGGGERLLIGGKSMGGRIASMVADEVGALGVVCLGYPFHPARKPERTRTEHLEALTTPMLVLQGERDPMGRPEEVVTYQLSNAIEVRWMADGDHSLKPRRASGRTHEQNLADAVASILTFVGRVSTAR